MSTEGTATSAEGAAPGPPDDRQALEEEIERTRERLGETVEALVAQVDVKARAQDKARELTGRLKNSAAQARQQASASVRAKADQADVKGQAQQRARHLTGLLKSTAAQGRHRANTAASSIAQATPEPVKGAAGSAAAVTRRNRGPLSAAIGAVVAIVLAWLLIKRSKARS
jgi:chromosome segregation ATPase